MAADSKKRDRSADVERLAAQIYLASVTGAGKGARTPEAHAAKALEDARAFFRAVDEPSTEQQR